MAALTGIYAATGGGPALSERELAVLSALPEHAQRSRVATHAELLSALATTARRHGHALEVDDSLETGFVATLAGALRVVANVKGTGEQTFYCQGSSDELLRQLAEEIATTCGPQLVLPIDGDAEGVLVVPTVATARR